MTTTRRCCQCQPIPAAQFDRLAELGDDLEHDRRERQQTDDDAIRRVVMFSVAIDRQIRQQREYAALAEEERLRIWIELCPADVRSGVEADLLGRAA